MGVVNSISPLWKSFLPSQDSSLPMNHYRILFEIRIGIKIENKKRKKREARVFYTRAN